MFEIFYHNKQGEKSDWRQRLRSMFGKGSQEKARMVLVEGSPGIGKTTFCLKIANDWARKTIPKIHDFPVFKLILLLKCRDMDGDVMQAIDDQLLPEDIMEKKKKLLDYIMNEKKQEKILIILDGLDELPQVAEQFVDKLLRRKVLSRCSVLVTSRQEKGIEIRQRHDFDTLLQINGFTIEDASEYIRKHFRTVGPVDLVKGERLIQTIQENIFLHALRNNPLNLLLLCVVFEDHDGELPSNRTELYQTIYKCLLRRFCSKNDIEVDNEDDKALEKRCEGITLILGELAWKCLQEERPSFSQEELEEREKVRTNGRGVSASRLGLVFMEASVKRLNPKHQYHFLHRTFQEFLAAAYLIQLMKENINIFDNCQLQKIDITGKYRQVFLFVAGILGKDGAVFFNQIGEILFGKWYSHCLEGDGPFLFELLNESGAANDLAMVVCHSISIPQSLKLSLEDQHTLRLVRYACGATSQIHVEPWLLHKLSLTETNALNMNSANYLHGILEDSKTLKDLVISTDMTSLLARTLLKGLSSNSSISSFTLKSMKSIQEDVADKLGTGLSLCNSLTTVKLKLFSTSAWAHDISGTGLLKSTQLESVNLEYHGVPGGNAVHAFKLLLSKRSLISFSLTLFGDMEDCLASALSEGLSEGTALNCLTVVIHGSLSNHGATLLANGFLLNKTLHSLALKVLGDLPEHWTGVVDKIHELTANKSWKSLTLHPNMKGKFVDASFSLLDPISRVGLVEKTLTINLWGELSIRNTDILGGHLLQISPLSSLTLNVNGKVRKNVAECPVNFFVTCNVLLSLTINLSGEITSQGLTALQRLHREGQLQPFKLNVNGLVTEDQESSSAQNNCSTSFALLNHISNLTPNEVREIFSGSKSLTELSVAVDSHVHSVHNYAGTLSIWGNGLGDGLSNNKSLTTFSLTVHNSPGTSGIWGKCLGEGLSNNKSLTTFSLTVHNHTDTTGLWGNGLGEGLSNNKSLTTFSLTVHNYTDPTGNWEYGLGRGLSNNKSLTTFSLTVHNHTDPTSSWEYGLGRGLSINKSLTTFSFTVHNYAETIAIWANSLGEGLSNNKSLTTFSLTVHNHTDTTGLWGSGLGEGLSNNKSLTTFSLTVHNYTDPIGNWEYGLGRGLSNNKSLTTFSFTVHIYADTIGIWGNSLGEGLSNNKSLTTFSFTVHIYADTIGIWGNSLGEGLSNNKSLTTFSLTVHNHTDTTGLWGNGLGEGLSNNKSLTTFSLTVHNYADTISIWGNSLGEGLSNNKSLTTFSLTVHDHADTTGLWGNGLGEGLSNNKSLTTFSLTVHNHADTTGLWGNGLGEGLSNNKSLTTFSLTVHNHTDTTGSWGNGLGPGLSNNESLTTFSLTVHNHADTTGSWGNGLGYGLSNNKSLTTFSLTVHDHADTTGSWGNCLGYGLSNNKSLTTFSLTVHNHADTTGNWGNGLGRGLSNNESLTTFSLTVHRYTDMSKSCGVRNLVNFLAKSCSLTTLRLAINDHFGRNRDLDYLLFKSLEEFKSLTSLNISVSLYGEDNVELN